MVEVTDFPLELTGRAWEMVAKAKRENEAKDGPILRVGVKGGGCSGFEYSLSFVRTVYDDDVRMVHDGLEVVIDGFSAHFLKGTMLDYTSSLQGAGFKFENPEAKRTCGCGQSFAL